MNKIFLHNHTLVLTIDPAGKGVESENIKHFNTAENLKKLIKHFEQQKQFHELTICFRSEKEKLKAINSIYKVIEAAGGIVTNSNEDVLMIFRHGKWDLPKGKIEKGEGESEAAVREVEEECGISHLHANQKFMKTYHTYQLNGKDILKISHWYLMRYSGKTLALVPQTEEGISEARWMTRPEIRNVLSNSYPSIVEVMNKYLHGS